MTQKKKGLTPPNQKNIGKVLNRLTRMSVPYDSYSASVYGSYAKGGGKTGSSFDSVIGNKKFDAKKSQQLFKSSNKENQMRRATRLARFSAEQSIGTDKGYKGYSGKKDKNKTNIVKEIKKFRLMGNLKKLSPFGFVSAIMTPKEAGAGSTLTQSGEYVVRKKVKTY